LAERSKPENIDSTFVESVQRELPRTGLAGDTWQGNAHGHHPHGLSKGATHVCGSQSPSKASREAA
jgi:hypothetical protein